ncbi:hypothetical protein L9F63_021727, partial [Diploptera punctata]
ASSSNEAVHLQQRLRSLSTELVTLRNRLHVSQPAATVPPPPHANNNNNHHSNNIHSSQQPIVPPRHTTLPTVPQHINTVEPFIGTTGKCHQQRLSSEKKTATSLSQQQQHHQQLQQQHQPPLVTVPEDNQQQSSQQQVTVAMRPVGCAELEDLIHLAGPLTEDAVLKCLQARFCASQFFIESCQILWILM